MSNTMGYGPCKCESPSLEFHIYYKSLVGGRVYTDSEQWRYCGMLLWYTLAVADHRRDIAEEWDNFKIPGAGMGFSLSWWYSQFVTMFISWGNLSWISHMWWLFSLILQWKSQDHLRKLNSTTSFITEY